MESPLKKDKYGIPNLIKWIAFLGGILSICGSLIRNNPLKWAGSLIMLAWITYLILVMVYYSKKFPNSNS
jgi:hypothetical protein